MRKRMFQALSAAALCGLGAWFFVLTQPESSEALGSLQLTADAESTQAAVVLSDEALAIHEEVAEDVAARASSDNLGFIDQTDKTYPEWLQDVIDQGYVDERYAHLWLQDDYLEVLQEQFHVLRHDSDIRWSEGCDRYEIPGGEVICWNEWGYSPYFSYDMATLREAAQTDAAASEALAYRSTDREDSLYYALRASNMSGKPGPIVRYLGTYSGNPQGDPNSELLIQDYILALVVEEMGYPYRHSVEIAARLEKRGVTRTAIDEALIAGISLREPRGSQQ